MNNCGSCRYYFALETSCRRRSPVAHPIPIPKPSVGGMSIEIQVVSVWPATQPSGWCGEWETRLD